MVHPDKGWTIFLCLYTGDRKQLTAFALSAATPAVAATNRTSGEEAHDRTVMRFGFAG
jgi:hypothetical protein